MVVVACLLEEMHLYLISLGLTCSQYFCGAISTIDGYEEEMAPEASCRC